MHWLIGRAVHTAQRFPKKAGSPRPLCWIRPIFNILGRATGNTIRKPSRISMLLPLELFLSECSDFFLHRWQSPPVGIMPTWEFKTDQPKTDPDWKESNQESARGRSSGGGPTLRLAVGQVSPRFPSTAKGRQVRWQLARWQLWRTSIGEPR